MVLIGSLDCLERFFILECHNRNQRNHFSQSQMTHTKQWTNQNSKYFHVTDVKRGKICYNAFGFTYDWKDGHEFFSHLFKLQDCVKHKKNPKHTSRLLLFSSSLSDSAKARANARSSSSCAVCDGLEGFTAFDWSCREACIANASASSSLYKQWYYNL